MSFAVVLASLTLIAPGVSAESISYVYNGDTSSHMRSNDTIDEVVRISRRWDGAYLWARVDGRAHLIRDAGILEAAGKAFATLDRLELKLREAENKLRPLDRRVDSIEQRSDALSDSLDDRSLSDAERDRIEAALKKLEDEHRTASAEARKAEAVVDELERQQEIQERIAEKELERIIVDAIRAGRSVPAN